MSSPRREKPPNSPHNTQNLAPSNNAFFFSDDPEEDLLSSFNEDNIPNHHNNDDLTPPHSPPLNKSTDQFDEDDDDDDDDEYLMMMLGDASTRYRTVSQVYGTFIPPLPPHSPSSPQSSSPTHPDTRPTPPSPHSTNYQTLASFGSKFGSLNSPHSPDNYQPQTFSQTAANLNSYSTHELLQTLNISPFPSASHSSTGPSTHTPTSPLDQFNGLSLTHNGLIHVDVNIPLSTNMYARSNSSSGNSNCSEGSIFINFDEIDPYGIGLANDSDIGSGEDNENHENDQNSQNKDDDNFKISNNSCHANNTSLDPSSAHLSNTTTPISGTFSSNTSINSKMLGSNDCYSNHFGRDRNNSRSLRDLFRAAKVSGLVSSHASGVMPLPSTCPTTTTHTSSLANNSEMLFSPLQQPLPPIPPQQHQRQPIAPLPSSISLVQSPLTGILPSSRLTTAQYDVPALVSLNINPDMNSNSPYHSPKHSENNLKNENSYDDNHDENCVVNASPSTSQRSIASSVSMTDSVVDKENTHLFFSPDLTCVDNYFVNAAVIAVDTRHRPSLQVGKPLFVSVPPPTVELHKRAKKDKEIKEKEQLRNKKEKEAKELQQQFFQSQSSSTNSAQSPRSTTAPSISNDTPHRPTSATPSSAQNNDSPRIPHPQSTSSASGAIYGSVNTVTGGLGQEVTAFSTLGPQFTKIAFSRAQSDAFSLTKTSITTPSPLPNPFPVQLNQFDAFETGNKDGDNHQHSEHLDNSLENQNEVQSPRNSTATTGSVPPPPPTESDSANSSQNDSNLSKNDKPVYYRGRSISIAPISVPPPPPPPPQSGQYDSFVNTPSTIHENDQNQNNPHNNDNEDDMFTPIIPLAPPSSAIATSSTPPSQTPSLNARTPTSTTRSGAYKPRIISSNHKAPYLNNEKPQNSMLTGQIPSPQLASASISGGGSIHQSGLLSAMGTPFLQASPGIGMGLNNGQGGDFSTMRLATTAPGTSTIVHHQESFSLNGAMPSTHKSPVLSTNQFRTTGSEQQFNTNPQHGQNLNQNLAHSGQIPNSPTTPSSATTSTSYIPQSLLNSIASSPHHPSNSVIQPLLHGAVINTTKNHDVLVPKQTSLPINSSRFLATLSRSRTQHIGSETFAEYEIIVIFPPLTWTIWRRYSEFETLYSNLSKCPCFTKSNSLTIRPLNQSSESLVRAGHKLPLPKLPPKKIFNRLSKSFISDRQALLTVWWDNLMQYVEVLLDIRPFLEFTGMVKQKEDESQKALKHIKNNTVYIDTLLDQNNTQIYEGDVLLFHTQGLLQTLQRGYLRASYDHVGIVVRVPDYSNTADSLYLFESTTDGVQLYPLKRRLFAWAETGAYIAYRRLVGTRTPEMKYRLYHFVIENENKQYSITSARVWRNKYLGGNTSKQAKENSTVILKRDSSTNFATTGQYGPWSSSNNEDSTVAYPGGAASTTTTTTTVTTVTQHNQNGGGPVDKKNSGTFTTNSQLPHLNPLSVHDLPSKTDQITPTSSKSRNSGKFTDDTILLPLDPASALRPSPFNPLSANQQATPIAKRMFADQNDRSNSNTSTTTDGQQPTPEPPTPRSLFARNPSRRGELLPSGSHHPSTDFSIGSDATPGHTPATPVDPDLSLLTPLQQAQFETVSIDPGFQLNDNHVKAPQTINEHSVTRTSESPSLFLNNPQSSQTPLSTASPSPKSSLNPQNHFQPQLPYRTGGTVSTSDIFSRPALNIQTTSQYLSKHIKGTDFHPPIRAANAYFCSELIAFAWLAMQVIDSSRDPSSYLPTSFSDAHTKTIPFLNGMSFEPECLLSFKAPEITQASYVHIGTNSLNQMHVMSMLQGHLERQQQQQLADGQQQQQQQQQQQGDLSGNTNKNGQNSNQTEPKFSKNAQDNIVLQSSLVAAQNSHQYNIPQGELTLLIEQNGSVAPIMLNHNPLHAQNSHQVTNYNTNPSNLQSSQTLSQIGQNNIPSPNSSTTLPLAVAQRLNSTSSNTTIDSHGYNESPALIRPNSPRLQLSNNNSNASSTSSSSFHNSSSNPQTQPQVWDPMGSDQFNKQAPSDTSIFKHQRRHISLAKCLLQQLSPEQQEEILQRTPGGTISSPTDLNRTANGLGNDEPMGDGLPAMDQNTQNHQNDPAKSNSSPQTCKASIIANASSYADSNHSNRGSISMVKYQRAANAEENDQNASNQQKQRAKGAKVAVRKVSLIRKDCQNGQNGQNSHSSQNIQPGPPQYTTLSPSAVLLPKTNLSESVIEQLDRNNSSETAPIHTEPLSIENNHSDEIFNFDFDSSIATRKRANNVSGNVNLRQLFLPIDEASTQSLPAPITASMTPTIPESNSSNLNSERPASPFFDATTETNTKNQNFRNTDHNSLTNHRYHSAHPISPLHSPTNAINSPTHSYKGSYFYDASTDSLSSNCLSSDSGISGSGLDEFKLNKEWTTSHNLSKHSSDGRNEDFIPNESNVGQNPDPPSTEATITNGISLLQEPLTPTCTATNPLKKQLAVPPPKSADQLNLSDSFDNNNLLRDELDHLDLIDIGADHGLLLDGLMNCDGQNLFVDGEGEYYILEYFYGEGEDGDDIDGFDRHELLKDVLVDIDDDPNEQTDDLQTSPLDDNVLDSQNQNNSQPQINTPSQSSTPNRDQPLLQPSTSPSQHQPQNSQPSTPSPSYSHDSIPTISSYNSGIIQIGPKNQHVGVLDYTDRPKVNPFAILSKSPQSDQQQPHYPKHYSTTDPASVHGKTKGLRIKSKEERLKYLQIAGQNGQLAGLILHKNGQSPTDGTPGQPIPTPSSRIGHGSLGPLVIAKRVNRPSQQQGIRYFDVDVSKVQNVCICNPDTPTSLSTPKDGSTPKREHVSFCPLYQG